MVEIRGTVVTAAVAVADSSATDADSSAAIIVMILAVEDVEMGGYDDDDAGDCGSYGMEGGGGCAVNVSSFSSLASASASVTASLWFDVVTWSIDCVGVTMIVYIYKYKYIYIYSSWCCERENECYYN
jgi:hypothetical protein